MVHPLDVIEKAKPESVQQSRSRYVFFKRRMPAADEESRGEV